eukprot:15174653-Alexandrium_andersonii.AAC.1
MGCTLGSFHAHWADILRCPMPFRGRVQSKSCKRLQLIAVQPVAGKPLRARTDLAEAAQHRWTSSTSASDFLTPPQADRGSFKTVLEIDFQTLAPLWREDRHARASASRHSPPPPISDATAGGSAAPQTAPRPSLGGHRPPWTPHQRLRRAGGVDREGLGVRQPPPERPCGKLQEGTCRKLREALFQQFSALLHFTVALLLRAEDWWHAHARARPHSSSTPRRCAADAASCSLAGHFSLDVGQLTLVGPEREQSFTCISGQTCAFDGVQGQDWQGAGAMAAGRQRPSAGGPARCPARLGRTPRDCKWNCSALGGFNQL